MSRWNKWGKGEKDYWFVIIRAKLPSSSEGVGQRAAVGGRDDPLSCGLPLENHLNWVGLASNDTADNLIGLMIDQSVAAVLWCWSNTCALMIWRCYRILDRSAFPGGERYLICGSISCLSPNETIPSSGRRLVMKTSWRREMFVIANTWKCCAHVSKRRTKSVL